MLSMNSVIKGTNYNILSYQSVLGNTNPITLDIEIDMENKLNAICDKCSHSEICSCLHVKEDVILQYNDEDNILKFLNEDNGLNSEIEKCIKLLSPEGTKRKIDFHSNDYLEKEISQRKNFKGNSALKEKTSLRNYEDKSEKPFVLKGEQKAELNKTELITSENLHYVDVENQKDTFEVDILECKNIEANLLKVINEDNGLNAEIERCVKLLTPKSSKHKMGKHSNSHMKRKEIFQRKKLKLDNSELKEKIVDNSNYIKPITPETKRLHARNIENLRDVNKNYFLQYSNKDNLFKFLRGEMGLNSKISKSEKFPREKTNIEIDNIAKYAHEAVGKELLKLDNNKLKAGMPAVSNQVKSLKSLIKELADTKSSDTELIAFNTTMLGSVNAEEDKNHKMKQNIAEHSNKSDLIKILNEDHGLNSEIAKCEKLLNQENTTNIKIDNSSSSHVENEILHNNNNNFKQEMSLVDVQNKSEKISPVMKEEFKIKLTDDELAASGTKKPDSGCTGGTKIGITTDYYEDEKDDIKDPGWLKYKELTTNEERYKHIKMCWGSVSVPNPHRNLTYHSYRKRLLNTNKLKNRQIKQHKRQASTNLNGHDAKRARPCTYKLDDQINSIKARKRKHTDEIRKEMQEKISVMDEYHFHQIAVMRQQSYNTYRLNRLRGEYQRNIEDVKDEFDRKAYQCDAQCESEIKSLTRLRDEVLIFYSLYKDVHRNREADPTILSQVQLVELDEIEKMYEQMDKHYQ